MTTRLYCRECGWRPEFRRKRAAFRAAARHQCTGTPVAETCPPWWSRLWTNLWTDRADAAAVEPKAASTTAPVNGRTGRCRGNRIQWAALAAHHAETTRRARQAMVEIVRAGYQIGPPPYGYRALRIRVTDPSGHSKLRAVLVPDWQTAAVVKQIFIWRADDGLTFAVIAARLNSDPRQYPHQCPTGSGPPRPSGGSSPTSSTPAPGLGPHRRRPPGARRAVGHLGAEGARAAGRRAHLPPRPARPTEGGDHGLRVNPVPYTARPGAGHRFAVHRLRRLGSWVLAAFGGGHIAWVADPDPHVKHILAARMPDVPNLGDLRASTGPRRARRRARRRVSLPGHLRRG